MVKLSLNNKDKILEKYKRLVDTYNNKTDKEKRDDR